MELNLIGRCQLVTDDATVDLSVTAQRLLGLLGLRGHTVTRLALAGVLWPERTEARALSNLRAALWRLDDVQRGVLRVADDGVGLGDQVRVDLRALRARCLVGLRSGRIGDDLGSDPRLVHDLCDTFDESWAEPERERWRQLRLHTLVRYAEQLEADGEHARSRAVVERALVGAPRHESLRDAPRATRRDERCHELRRPGMRGRLRFTPEPLDPTTAHN
jgi:DNA-binding SARP family transcriptional activator